MNSSSLRLSKRRALIAHSIFSLIPYLVLGVMLAITLLPLISMVGTSLRSFETMYTTRTIFPEKLSLDFYNRVLGDARVLRYFRNSFITAVVAASCTVLLSVFGGYAMARFRRRVPGIRFFIIFILMVQMFPVIQMLIPLYLTLSGYSLIDRSYTLMLVYPAFTLPMSLMMMQSFIEGVPYEMEEAGRIDDCNRMQVILKLVLPVSKPGIASALILAFNFCWNEFMIAILLIKNDRFRTMPIGLNNYMMENSSDWGSIMAAATLMAIPVLLFLNVLQKHIVGGLTMGAVKG